jgi:hypothetical protein
MSTSNKPTLHLDHSGAVVIGRQSKSSPELLIGEVMDVSGRFRAIVLAAFGPEGEGKKETEWKSVTVDEDGNPKTARIRITVERIPDEA